MTTEDMIETFISEGIRAYKKNSGDCFEARRLNRHESVVIEGQEFKCWREYVIYRMAEYICKIIPEAKVEIVLDGNDSTIKIELNNFEQQKLNRKMFLFLQKINKA